MNTRTSTLTIVVAATLAAALTGCSPAVDAANPITSATKTTITTPATPTSTSTTLDPAAKESQDRQDAELVWRKFIGLTITIASLPADQVEPAITQVAVDPQLTRLRDENSKLRAQHQAGYCLLYTSPSPRD